MGSFACVRCGYTESVAVGDGRACLGCGHVVGARVEAATTPPPKVGHAQAEDVGELRLVGRMADGRLIYARMPPPTFIGPPDVFSARGMFAGVMCCLEPGGFCATIAGAFDAGRPRGAPIGGAA